MPRLSAACARAAAVRSSPRLHDLRADRPLRAAGPGLRVRPEGEHASRASRHVYPIDDPNPFYERDYNKCILCRRCVRACHEHQRRGSDRHDRSAALSTQDRHRALTARCRIEPVRVLRHVRRGLPDRRRWCRCSARATGATGSSSRRPPSCSYCGVGCQFDLQVKDNQIVQVASKWDAPANHGWTCVKGRFGLGLRAPPRPADHAADAPQRTARWRRPAGTRRSTWWPTRLEDDQDEHGGPPRFGAFDLGQVHQRRKLSCCRSSPGR